MATATAMYYSGLNPLKRISEDSESVFIPRGMKQRRLHKAFLRYHDPENWLVLRDALKNMGRPDLIGPGKSRLVPAEPEGRALALGEKIAVGEFRTQHTRK